MVIKTRRVGRPHKPANLEDGMITLTLSIRPELKEALRLEAKKSGRSLSQETRIRLEKALWRIEERRARAEAP